MLLGLGVDYAIHGAVRFDRWRAHGVDPQPAMRRAITETSSAVRASAWTTMAAFLVLATARFAPLRELGIAVAVGILATLAASLMVGASLLAASPTSSRRPATLSHFAGLLEASIRRLTTALAGRDRAVAILALVATAAVALGIGRIRTEADLESFRPSNHPAKGVEHLLMERFGLGVDTMTLVVAGADLDSALQKAASVSATARHHLGNGATVTSPSDWLLPRATALEAAQAWDAEALEAGLEAIRRSASQAGVSLAPAARALDVWERVAAGRLPEPVSGERWPEWLSETIRPGPETTSVSVLVRGSEKALTPAAASKLARLVKNREPGTVVASADLVGEELRRSVLSGLGRLGGWCALAIGLGVLISFRGNARRTLLALLPVAFGLIWVLGLVGWLGIPLDPLSAMMAPLVLGIGIDDGLHVLHVERARPGMRNALAAVGPSIALTTLTTCAGFGSLLLSSVPTLQRAGALVALGTLSCLLITLVALPAAARLTAGRP
jgi:predicted RND superfamily exporter protein